MQMKHAQRTEKYIRLKFNSYISDGDFFGKSMRIIDMNYFFSGDFQGQEGGAHYATLMTERKLMQLIVEDDRK
jgi:hypothetical protein